MTKRRALLDTSAILDPPADLAALADQVCISTVSLAELAEGLHPGDHVEAARRADAYALITATFEAIPFSAHAARLYGALEATARDQGRSPLRRFDLLIAAVAASERLPVISSNPRALRGLHPSVRVIEASERA